MSGVTEEQVMSIIKDITIGIEFDIDGDLTVSLSHDGVVLTDAYVDGLQIAKIVNKHNGCTCG